MRRHQKIISLYGESHIQAVKQVISIGDEEDLNQFWEHILTYHAIHDPRAYGFFVALYELSARFLEESEGVFFEIIVEQSDEAYFFTVWNRVFVEFAEKIWKEREIEYVSDEKRITVRLLRSSLVAKTHTKERQDAERIRSLLSSVAEGGETVRIPPYDFLSGEDLRELGELTEDLSELLYEAQKAGFSNDVFIRMRSLFSMMSITLNFYPQIEEVALIMSEFSMLISRNADAVSQLENGRIAMIEGFVHNFERWLKILFVEGGAQLHFMNRSLRADMEMIRTVIEPPQEEGEVDVDDIFNF